jgi:hypothetical protein
MKRTVQVFLILLAVASVPVISNTARDLARPQAFCDGTRPLPPYFDGGGPVPASHDGTRPLPPYFDGTRPLPPYLGGANLPSRHVG